MFGIDDAMMAAAIPAVLDIAGGFMSNQSNKDIANQANQFSAAQSQAQMDFQKEMRATQYQTSVEDLKKAGLNPMLAYSQGSAGNLVGSAAQAQRATMENPLKGVTQSALGGANLAMQTAVADQNVNESISRQAVNEETAKKLDAETSAVVLAMPNISQELKNKLALEMLHKAQTGLSSAQAANTKQQTIIAEPEAWAAKTYGHGKQIVGDVSQGVSSAKDAIYKGKKK